VVKLIKGYILNVLGEVQAVRVSRARLFSYLKAPSFVHGRRVWVSPKTFKTLVKKYEAPVRKRIKKHFFKSREHKYTKDDHVSYWIYTFKHKIRFTPEEADKLRKPILKDVKSVRYRNLTHRRQRLVVELQEINNDNKIVQTFHVSTNSFLRRKNDYEYMVENMIERLSFIKDNQEGSSLWYDENTLLLRKVLVLYFKK